MATPKAKETAPPADVQPADSVVDRLLGSLLRGTGFVVLSSMALTILAAVVLLPAYGQYLTVRHQRDLTARRVEQAEANLAAMDRLLAEARDDDVLTQRLAWSRLGLCPSGEVRVLPEDRTALPQPGELAPIVRRTPPPPDARVLGMARRCSSPARRRGMLALAGAMLLTALLLFAPPERSPAPTEPSAASQSSRSRKRAKS